MISPDHASCSASNMSHTEQHRLYQPQSAQEYHVTGGTGFPEAPLPLELANSFLHTTSYL